MSDIEKNPNKESAWCVCADIIADPSGLENESEINQFGTGARVYIIDWFPGMGESIVVIGQHRKSRKYIKTIINIKLVKNPRLILVDNPDVVNLLREHEAEAGFSTDRNFMECILGVITEWQEDDEWE